MRVGILTYHFSSNHGAVLQAYALRTWLKQTGHDVSFVNYVPRHVEGGGTLRLSLTRDAMYRNLKVSYLWLSKIREATFGARKTREALERFLLLDLRCAGRRYSTAAELEAAELSYDLLICGSDQIWGYSDHYGVDPVYFANFKCEARRISYAPSFGANDYPNEVGESVGKMLMCLDAISVREPRGLELVSKLCGRRAICVPDPTFLLDNYLDLLSGQHAETTGRTVFAYALRSGEGFAEVIRFLTGNLNAKAVSGYNPHRRWPSLGQLVHGGPREWLFALRASSFVVTNSFHGTVFSILFKRPFLVIRVPDRRSRVNERTEHLLKSVGLEDRIIDSGDLDAVYLLAAREIDWENVNRRVEHLRQVGRNFLAANLKRQE